MPPLFTLCGAEETCPYGYKRFDFYSILDYNVTGKSPAFGLSVSVNPKALEPPLERKEICHDL